MADNYATEYSNSPTTTKFTKASMEVPIKEIDEVLTYFKGQFISCEGILDWEYDTSETEGTLSWSGVIHIYFNRDDGEAVHNQINAGSIVLENKEFFYVTLDPDTPDQVLSPTVGIINDGSASNFLAFDILCMGHCEESDTSDDDLMFYPRALAGIYFPTTYNDIQFSVQGGTVGPSTPTSEEFTTNTEQVAFSVGNNMDLACNELAHWWKEGSNVLVHVDITTKASPSQDENFACTVFIAYQDSSKDWQEIERSSGDVSIVDGTPALRGFDVEVGAVLDFSGLTIGSQVVVRVERIAASGTEYTGDIFINQVGFHAIKNSPGSRVAEEK